MKAVETLKAEHDVILAMLTELERYGHALLSGEDVSAEDLGGFVEFFREYADARHHHKEEDILFAAMEQHGFPREGGPLAVMLYEHEVGRAEVGKLAGVAEKPAPWSQDDRNAASAAAQTFAAMLRAHIDKENNILYPMAERQLPSDAQAAVDEACARKDEEGSASGWYAKLDALGARLTSR